MSHRALGGQWWIDGEGGPGTGATARVFKHDDDVYELTNVQKGYDAPKGVGRQLLDKIHETADHHGATLQAHLLPGNPRLLHFYKAAGYEVTKESTVPFGGPLITRRPRRGAD